MTDNQAGGAAGRMMRDVLLYTAARLALVVVLTAAVYFAAGLFHIQLPLVVAMLFAIILALPLGLWLLKPLRMRATAGIAQVDERRRRDRNELESRLRGEDSADTTE